MERPQFNYIGQCPKCGAYCVATVDDPQYAKDTATSVANMIKNGLTVTRVDSDFVRANFSGCTCHKQAKQSAQVRLFE